MADYHMLWTIFAARFDSKDRSSKGSTKRSNKKGAIRKGQPKDPTRKGNKKIQKERYETI